MVYGTPFDVPQPVGSDELVRAGFSGHHPPAAAGPGRILAAGLGRSGDALTTALADSWHTIHLVERIDAAMRELERARPDTVVVGIAEGSAAAARLLRAARRARVPAIMALIPRLAAPLVDGALAAGAHDVIAPPHAARAILLRRRVLLRRAPRAAAPSPPLGAVVELGPLKVDLARREVRGDEGTLRLSGREFELLVRLMEARGEVVSRASLLQDIWGEEAGSEAVLDATVHRLRRKLGSSTAHGPLIATVRGVGYSLDAAAPGPGAESRGGAATRFNGSGAG